MKIKKKFEVQMKIKMEISVNRQEFKFKKGYFPTLY